VTVEFPDFLGSGFCGIMSPFPEVSPMRRSAVVAVFLCLVAALGLPAQNAPVQKVVKGPVVSNVQTDRATLTWVTHRTSGALRKEGDAGTQVIEEPVYHRVEMKGLQPGTRYSYDLSSYGADARGSFVTAPDGDAPFSFLVFGDTRTRHEFHRKIAARMTTEKASFILHTGDLVANGLLSEDWDIFFDVERQLLRTTGFFPVYGNHDRSADIFTQYFAFPGGNPHRFSFNWGTVHIVGLDSNEVGTTPQDRNAFRQEMLAWLKDDLRRNKKPLTFVYFHHPLYSAVESRKGSAAKLAELYEPLFIEGGVTAIFAGHDHNYQHHVAKGIHHIVTGGGGAPLYEVDPIPEITLKAVKVENYVRVTVNGSKAKVEGIDIDGKLLESFEMTGRPAPPPVPATGRAN
jgi:predicted phosphodiesterase